VTIEAAAVVVGPEVARAVFRSTVGMIVVAATADDAGGGGYNSFNRATI
jgi:hypothetical protein